MTQLILFNKPFGVLTQFSSDVPKSKNTLAGYIHKPDFYAAGRLDKNSEGLLLLTNNGSLQHQLTHPKFEKEKRYWVQVEGIPEDRHLLSFRQGLTIKNQTFLPAQVRIIEAPVLWPRNPPVRVRQHIPTSWLEIILKEGKNHQIRKMTATIGYPTLRLVRYQIGPWKLEKLQPGEWVLVK